MKYEVRIQDKKTNKSRKFTIESNLNLDKMLNKIKNGYLFTEKGFSGCPEYKRD